MIGIEQDRDGKEKRRSERQRNGTESLRQDPKRNRRAMRGLATEERSIDKRRNGKAKIPRRRNPAERMEIWQSLKLGIESR